VLVASATGLSLVRWTENYHLFFLGALSFIVATIARIALRQSWRSRLRVHLASMGLSYILMLTAIIMCVMLRHPLHASTGGTLTAV
jgi:glucan phosphoethanolaminetransferase (alkaline phosphatase superfamily)